MPTKINNISEVIKTTNQVDNFEDINTINSGIPFEINSSNISVINFMVSTTDFNIETTRDIDSKVNKIKSIRPTQKFISNTTIKPSHITETTSQFLTKVTLSTIKTEFKEQIKYSTKVFEEVRVNVDKDCGGLFAYPNGCSVLNCSYYFEWLINGKQKSIDFRFFANLSQNRWSGIGFSRDGSMVKIIYLVRFINNT